jgi:hypothetical protein
VVAIVATSLLVGTAQAATIDLVDQVGLRLERPARPLGFGEVSVARAGDVDGDELDDLLLTADGVVHVFPGRPSLRSAPRLGFRHGGYRLLGPEGLTAAAPAGDLNGDGLADVIVAAPDEHAFYRRLGPRRRESVDGAAYVVLGSRRHQDVHLGRLGSRGFRIAGTERNVAASGIGDVNGDGLDDVATGAAYRNGGGVSVVYGSTEPRPVRVDRVEGRGFEIRPRQGDLALGSALAPIGDFDGDGLPDFAISDVISLGRPPDPKAYEEIGRGAVYIVFGARTPETLRLRHSKARALRVHPARRGFATGYALAGPGDVNGDGLADLAVGAPASFGRALAPGSAWVVFGSPSRARVDLSRLGTRGFRIAGARHDSGVGAALEPAGDVDGDGLADLMVGAPGGFEGEGLAAGVAYVVEGTQSTGRVDVGDLERAGERGFVLRGLPGDHAGDSLAAPGDMDGDGRPELAVTAPESCAGAGSAYAREPTELRSTAVVYLATVGVLAAARSTDGPDRLDATRGGERLRGRGGADRIVGSSVADCLYGDRGRDRMMGRGGGDVLLGGPDRDHLSGGGGTDLLHAADGSADRLDCGSGRDRAVVDPLDRASGCERVRRRSARAMRRAGPARTAASLRSTLFEGRKRMEPPTGGGRKEQNE